MLSYLPLLLAVTSAVQASPAPSPAPRAHRRARATTIAPLTVPVDALEARANALVAASEARANALVAAVAFAAPGFFWDGDDDEDVSEPRWPDQAQADVADSLYRAARQDRKSTRLNSSHSSISYAVFCLKKKKKI